MERMSGAVEEEPVDRRAISDTPVADDRRPSTLGPARRP